MLQTHTSRHPAPQLPPALSGAAHRPRRRALAPRASQGSPPPSPLPDWRCTDVLKEWASVCASIAAGQTTVLLRKGGIAEKTKGFKLQSRRFALYPTAFHGAAELLQPRAASHAAAAGVQPGDDAPLQLLAECTAAWQTDDPAVLAALAAMHPWAEGLLETRFQWKPEQPITVLELRALNLPAPGALLRGAPEHAGCRSWIALDERAGISAAPGAAYALDDAAFALRQADTRAALRTLRNVVPIPLPEA